MDGYCLISLKDMYEENGDGSIVYEEKYTFASPSCTHFDMTNGYWQPGRLFIFTQKQSSDTNDYHAE